jgi:hypothetical protein
MDILNKWFNRRTMYTSILFSYLGLAEQIHSSLSPVNISECEESEKKENKLN